ncbi:MAG: hypothetical protein ACRDJE_20820 [Dehalococcoidia bacterium]
MLKWLVVLGLIIGGGYLVYKRLLAPVDDSWDDDSMYGSAELHEAADTVGTTA